MQYFRDEIANALASSGQDRTLADFIEQPEDSSLGDYALPCFSLAKSLRKSPQAIAQELAAQPWPACFAKIESKGGYLNFFVDRAIFNEKCLEAVFLGREAYGRGKSGDGKTVVMDFSSPNIAKPFSISHLRSTNIGAAIREVLRFSGYNVIGINYLGDWGTQFGKMITAFKHWGDEERLGKDPILYLLDLYVRFHSEAKANSGLEDEARQWFVRLEKGDAEATALWQRFREISLAEFKRVYDLLGVDFEHFQGESFFNDKLSAAVAELQAKNLLVASDDAEIVSLEQFELPPALIRKRDGAALYLTRDLAAALYRKREYKADTLLYVVGMEQKLHFRQLFTVLGLLGHDWAKDCHHADFGLFKFADGAMSTREGKVVFLLDVIEQARAIARQIIDERSPDLPNKDEVALQVGVGAIKFFDLFTKRGKDVTFAWNEILNFDGETGPYVQYTFARINSVLAKADKTPAHTDISSLALSEDAEFAVIKRLSAFPDCVAAAAKHYEPSFVARYAIALARDFNQFYNQKRILDAPDATRDARLVLCDCVRIVLKSALRLLGIEAPVRM